MARYEVRPFTAEALDDAGRILSERHRHQRRSIFALDRKYETAATAREQVAALFDKSSSSGAIVAMHGRAIAYVLGTRRPESVWGPNVWVEDAGSGGTDVEAIREAYAAAAAQWVEDGRTSHYVVVPATDTQALEAWFSLSFGKQQVHALREPVWREFEPALSPGLSVRRATRDDFPALAEIDVSLPQHQAGTAVFTTLPVPTVEEALADLESDFDDPAYATFVAVHDGRVVGAAIGCSLDLSPGHTGLMRPRSCGFLGFASVLPEARGLGAGRALGETIMCWSRDEGYEWVATDWRSTNLAAARTWTALGFKPSFHRLHRAIVPEGHSVAADGVPSAQVTIRHVSADRACTARIRVLAGIGPDLACSRGRRVLLAVGHLDDRPVDEQHVITESDAGGSGCPTTQSVAEVHCMPAQIPDGTRDGLGSESMITIAGVRRASGRRVGTDLRFAAGAGTAASRPAPAVVPRR